jgi:hypothetical protein
MRSAMKILVTLIGLAMLGGIGCQLFKADPPKQRQEWTSSPMKYGDTQWEGLRAPGSTGADAGEGD